MGSEGSCYFIWINATRPEEWKTEILYLLAVCEVIMWFCEQWRRSQKVLRIEAPNYSKGWRMKTWEMSRSGSAAEAGARAGAKLELSVSALVSYNPSLLSQDVEIASPVLHTGTGLVLRTGNLLILLLQFCTQPTEGCWEVVLSAMAILYQKTKYSFGGLHEGLDFCAPGKNW